MSIKNKIKVVLLLGITSIDFITVKMFKASRVLLDNKVALMQMTDNASDYAAYKFYTNMNVSYLCYGTLTIVNLFIIYLLLRGKKNNEKDK